MRQYIAIFFVLLMIGVSSKELVHFIAFKVNQDYISAVFCTNKDKPEMKCDGKCYLKKTIDASKEESSEKPVSPPDEKSLVVYYAQSTDHASSADFFPSDHLFYYLAPSFADVSFDVIHPPEIFV